MAVNSHASEPLSTASDRGHSLVAGLMHFGARAFGRVNSVVRSLQTARMVSTLSAMSDQQLAECGTSRADIRRHADTLMARDGR